MINSDILDGFINLVFGDEVVDKKAKDRLAICFKCPLQNNGFCSKSKEYNGVKGCGCFLKLKTRSGSKCPLKKW